MVDQFGRDRSETLAAYILDTGATVRATAAKFGVSKSTVHKDLTVKLWYINRSMYHRVKEILNINKSQRHIRGGEATKRKYALKAQNN